MLATRRGDTVIEVIFAITIFCLVAIISVTLMSNGINTAQGSLELTMARNEIDAQAEALRFIQNSFLAEREVSADNQQFAQFWHRITRSGDECNYLGECGLAISPADLPDFDAPTCAEAYGENSSQMYNSNAFVINTRLLQPDSPIDEIIISARTRPKDFIPAPIQPRLLFSNINNDSDHDSDLLVETDDIGAPRLYRTVARAEGIWIIAVRGTQSDTSRQEPEFFDFYIRTCWNEPGNEFPTIIGTIVRLYNPEVIE